MSNIAWQHLNWFDYTIIGIIALSIIISFFRGFLREAVSLITWVLAIVLGLKFAPYLSVYLKPHIKSDTLNYFIAFAAIALAILIIGFIINVLLKMLLKKAGVTLTDRFLGIFFGAARGILAVAVIILLINVSSLQKDEWAKNSQLSPHFNVLVDWLKKFLPKKVQEVSQWVSQDNQPGNSDRG